MPATIWPLVNDAKKYDFLPSQFKLSADHTHHAITFLTFYGKERLSTQQNLFDVIQNFERRYVVDNHIDWFTLSPLPKNANTAFILGTTSDREASPLRLLLEDKSGKPKIRYNVFFFGMKSPTRKDILAGDRTPLLVISRLDEYATKILDMDGLRKFDQPGGEKVKWNSSKSIEDEKEKVLSLLAVTKIEDVDQITDRKLLDAKCECLIEQKKPECFKRFWESNDVARIAYARLLLSSRKARSEFARSDYPNVFGDVHIIQNALFFNAGYYSNDNAVKRMAEFSGLPKFGTI